MNEEQHGTPTGNQANSIEYQPTHTTSYNQFNEPISSQLNSTQLDDVSLDGSFVHPNVLQQQHQQHHHQQQHQFRHPQPVAVTTLNNQQQTMPSSYSPNTSAYSRGPQQSYPYANYPQSGQPQAAATTLNNQQQTMPPAYSPNTSVYSRGPHQVQSYPYGNYSHQQQTNHPPQPINYSQPYPVASHAYGLSNSIANPMNNISSSAFVTPYNPAAAGYYNRAPFVNNHLLNSSLHQPHSIDLNDSLSRSFNGVPSNFALMNPHPLQALQFLGQNSQVSAQITEFLTKYAAYEEAVRKSQSQATAKHLIPLKFEKLHSSVRFGNANQLIRVHGKSVYIQSIKPHLIEAGEKTLINTWPGPLIKDATNKNDVVEYIEGQQKLMVTHNLPAEHLYLNAEKGKLWQLLAMMTKLSGDVCSSELAEFLISKNESEFYTKDRDSELGIFRRFLLLGRKKNALEHSRKTGLWQHGLTLAYLISADAKLDETMIKLVNDFTDATLAKDDPIFTLYRRLLQKSNPKLLDSIGTVLPPSNLQQFTILLANGCEISPQLPGLEFTVEVLKLIVAIRDGKSNFIDLNALESYFLRSLIAGDSEKYSEELLFMNEIFEFCQKPNLPLIEIIPFKALFAAKLYDYGLVEQARKYCEVITNVYKSHLRYMCFDNQKMRRINWKLIMYIVEQIESKIDKVLNPQSVFSSFQATPLSQQIEDDQPSRTSSDAEEDSAQTDTINEDLADLRLNSEQSMQSSNPPGQLNLQSDLYQQQNKFAAMNRNPQFANNPAAQTLAASQQHQKKAFNQPPAPVQHRERSDSEQSYSRQRTTSRTSSTNFSFSGPAKSEVIQEQTPQKTKSQFSQPPANQMRTGDLPSLSGGSNLPLSNAPPAPSLALNPPQVKPPTRQEVPTKPQPIRAPASQSFFVPKFSPSDNLPPIDFVSKPPLDPTNFLEENEDEKNSSARLNRNPPSSQPSAMMNFNPTFNENNFAPNPNFNSTLNPPPPAQTSQPSQNYVFSPAVSPITSPVLNSSQTNRGNLTMRPDNRPEMKPTNTSLDQTDYEQSKNTEKSGFFSSW